MDRSGWLDRFTRVLGCVQIALGWAYGILADEYARGAFNILTGVVVLYLGGWRPESKVEVALRSELSWKRGDR